MTIDGVADTEILLKSAISVANITYISSSYIAMNFFLHVPLNVAMAFADDGLLLDTKHA